MPFSLPSELVDQGREEREQSWLSTITSDIDRTVKQGWSGLERVAGSIGQTVAPVKNPLLDAINSGVGLTVPSVDDLTPDWIKQAQQAASSLTAGVTVPTLDDLTPDWARPQPTAAPAAPRGGAAAAVPQAMPTGGGYTPVSPDEGVTRETVTRSAATALERAGLPTGMAPYLAGIAINEGILQPGTIARDYWSVGGVKAPGSAGVVTVPTREVINGQSVMQQGTFGRFNSMQEGMDALATFVRDSPRFGPVAQQAAQSGDYAGMIEGFRQQGYATDPEWTRKVTSIAAGLPATAPRPGAVQAEQTPQAQQQAAAGFDPQSITKAYEGVPYVFGGAGGRSDSRLGVATDCSGFVSAVWKNQFGLDLPAHTDAAYNALRQAGSPEVAVKDARPGDVVFYMGAGTGGAITHHMGVYAGNGKVLDMSTSAGGGAKLRPLGHAGEYVLLRDSRVNAQPPRTASVPPPIVETGIAEQTGGEKLSRTELARVASNANDPTMLRGPLSQQPELLPGDGGTVPEPAPVVGPGDGGYAPTPAPLYGPPLEEAGPPVPDAAIPGPDLSPQGTPIQSQPPSYGPWISETTAPPPSPYAPGQAESMTPPAEYQMPANPDPWSTGAIGEAARAATGPGGLLEPAAGGPRIMARIEEIETQAARELGYDLSTSTGYLTRGRATQDPGWRARNPALADEYDQLQKQLGVNLIGQVGDAAQVSRVARPRTLPDELIPEAMPGGSLSDDAGRVVSATGADPTVVYEMRPRVVDLDELIPSNMSGGAPNPAYPRELQPRSRERAASQLQIDQIARNLEPNALLTDAGRLDSGPPIVGPDLIVESGNGRVLALGRAAEQHPERYAAYVNDLRARLSEYGLPESAIAGKRRPVLVRERLTEVDRAAFAAEANNPGLLQMSSAELARADAMRLSDDLISGMRVGENDTIATALRRQDNSDVIQAFVRSLPPNERAAILDAGGKLSAQGMARLQSALLMRTYGGEAGERIARVFIESADPILRNVENAIMGSLPDTARAEALIRAGARDAGLSISEDVARTVEVLASLRTNGIKVSDYLAQGSLFARETTPLQDTLLEFMNANTRSAKPLREVLKDYAARVDAAADPNQVDMFGATLRVQKEDVLGAALDRKIREGQAAVAPVVRSAGEDALADPRFAAPPPDTAAQAASAGPRPPAPDPTAAPAAGARPSVARESVAPSDEVTRLRAENERLRAAVAQPLTRARSVPTRRPQATALPAGMQPIRMSAAEEVARIRLDKFPEEVRDLIQQSAGEQGWLHTQRRGVLPDEAVRELARADTSSVDTLIKNSRAGRAYNAEETVALRNAVASQATVVRELSEEIATARAGGMAPELLVARRAAEATRLDGLVKLAEGARTEAGRAFRAYRQQADLIELTPDQAVERIYRKLGGRDNAQQLVDEYTRAVQDGADPIVLAKLWAKVENGSITASELFALYRRFNMLSGPRTFEVNALSGAVNLGYEVVGSAAGQAARGRPVEAAAEVAAPFKAAGRAFQNMIETMQHGVSMEQAARGDIPRTLSSRTENPAAKGVLTVMEIPDRVNAGVDQFFRTMTEDWAATRLAQRMARDEKLTVGSPKWSEFVAQKLREIRDDPSKFDEIKAMADRVTFADEPGAVGKGLEAFRHRAPLVANLLFPFIRTPYNIASRAVDLSPVGVLRTGAEAATGLGRGRANLSPRVRDNLIGTAAAIWAYTQAQQGNITGAGPDDPEKIAMLRATGWQPYSVKIGDEYWSYANFAPFTLALSMGAAAHEAQQYAKPDQADVMNMLSDGAARTAKVVTDMTVLAGLGAVVKSIQDPDRYGTQWLSTFLSSMIPAGSFLNTFGQAMDPLLRRSERTDVATQVGQNLRSRVPWAREGVPPAQDPLGRAIPNPQTGLGALNPFRPTSSATPQPVLRAFLEAGVDIGKPRESLTIQGQTLELTAAEQRAWMEARGQMIERMAEPLIGRGSFANASQEGRARAFADIRDRAAEAATQQTLKDIGSTEIRRRMRRAS